MIDLSDSKHILLKSGRRILRYRCTCDLCGHDKGYMDKNAGVKHRLCRRCANVVIASKVHKGKVLSQVTRDKMSAAATARYNDPLWIKKSDLPKQHRVYKTWDSDIQRRIKHNIRSLVNHKLKRRGLTKKGNKTFKCLGYTPDDLVKHLESKWLPGMSWSNYGSEWHVDHVMPDSWFNYSSTEDDQFKKSWSLNNLQPLWAKDNLRKGNRV